MLGQRDTGQGIVATGPAVLEMKTNQDEEKENLEDGEVEGNELE